MEEIKTTKRTNSQEEIKKVSRVERLSGDDKKSAIVKFLKDSLGKADKDCFLYKEYPNYLRNFIWVSCSKSNTLVYISGTMLVKVDLETLKIRSTTPLSPKYSPENYFYARISSDLKFMLILPKKVKKDASPTQFAIFDTGKGSYTDHCAPISSNELIFLGFHPTCNKQLLISKTFKKYFEGSYSMLKTELYSFRYNNRQNLRLVGTFNRLKHPPTYSLSGIYLLVHCANYAQKQPPYLEI